MSDLAYLQHSLRILAPCLKRKNTVEVRLNRPGEVWLEHTKGAFRCVKDAALNSQALQGLARNLATATGQVYHPAKKGDDAANAQVDGGWCEAFGVHHDHPLIPVTQRKTNHSQPALIALA